MAKKQKVVEVSVSEMFEKLKEKMEEAEALLPRFEEKKIKSAGAKLRKVLQEIKKEIKPIRDRITEIKNEM